MINDDDLCNAPPIFTYGQPEFLDVVKVIEFGAKKYKLDGWLDKDGHGTSHKEMHNSMFHHLADSWNGRTKDLDSGLHPLLHLACRAIMMYTRQKRGIIHPNDEVKDERG